MRALETFDANERHVIYQRRRGWEKASEGALAAVFDTTRLTIRKIVQAEDRRGLPSHPDDVKGTT